MTGLTLDAALPPIPQNNHFICGARHQVQRNATRYDLMLLSINRVVDVFALFRIRIKVDV